ncbi:MAG: pyridoxal-phosphate dependent enzyme [Chloroflexi bacterium]|uniref:Pyridoxal-phosphate dependent enzyme n=1 Tax=Candidatus Chlorohelix allophototropha TaxID=3003348 RepID=A0A8T7M6Q9_9CHLR|nr:pyridoxal-phosphate dependent enzyme [Chloroflexota bacterium]WJW69559.1 pyridoxal-phosphate dependent enzyme [Chloroflexota bacterium L227-S17]
MLYPSLLAAIGNTPLVEISQLSPYPDSVRLYAKLEGHNPSGSIKDRIALSMIEAAERAGKLKPGSGQRILEPSSGNTGIALAMIGKLKGYNVTVVMPDSFTAERRQLLEIYGAKVVLSDGSKGSNGSVELALELAAKDSGYFMPFQYSNNANPDAHYRTTAPEIWRDLPDASAIVAGLGTGGTLMGLSRFLKEKNPAIQIVAVEPMMGEIVQGLRNLDGGFVPPIIELSRLDRKFVVTNAQSVRVQRALLDKTGIFAGVSCGAAVYGALKLAREWGESGKTGKIVVMLAESGWKYLSAGLFTHDLNVLEDSMEQKMWW